MLPKCAYGSQPVAHPAPGLGLGWFELVQNLRFLQQGRPADRQAILRELDLQSKVGGLAVGIRYRLSNVQRKVLEHGQVRFDQYAVIQIVARERLVDMMRGKSHHDIEIGRAIDLFAAKAL